MGVEVAEGGSYSIQTFMRWSSLSTSTSVCGPLSLREFQNFCMSGILNFVTNSSSSWSL